MISLRAMTTLGVFTSNICKVIPETLNPMPYQLDVPLCLLDPSIANLEQLVDCLDMYTVPHNYYNQVTYQAAQPSAEERQAWSDATASLLTADRNCSSIVLPLSIAGIYSISLYTEHTGASYCIMSEARIRDGVYVKGWGLVVVPASGEAVRRHIHLSAPHPQWDLHTPTQAAAIFKTTGAKSLSIPGRIRTAFLDPTDCVKGDSEQDLYYRTDPAHDTVCTLLAICFGVDDQFHAVTTIL